jgi:alcohol dehydrogenase class IV
MWLNYEYPAITFNEMRKVFGLFRLRRKAPFIAISSTSGTAMEINSFSIITDDKKGIKYSVAAFKITPDIAIIDSELTRGLPPKLVAHTGMDAFTLSNPRKPTEKKMKKLLQPSYYDRDIDF